MFCSRVSRDFEYPNGYSLMEIEGFKELKETILENLRMIIESFTFLQYLQIELYRGILKRQSKVYRELGTIQWRSGFLLRRLIYHIHSLLYRGPEIELPVFISNPLEKTGVVFAKENSKLLSTLHIKNASIFNQQQSFVSLINIREICSLLQKENMEQHREHPIEGTSSESSRELQKVSHVRSIQMLQKSLVQQLSKSSFLVKLLIQK